MKLHLRFALLAFWLALLPAAFAAAITDLAGNALTGGTSTDRFTTGETYILAAPNVAPTLAATAGSPTYNGGSPVFGIFSGTSAGFGSGDSGQTFAQFTFTISNLADGANELLNIDSTAYALGSSATSTSIGSLTVSVAVVVSSGTATVTVSKSGLTAANIATLINGLGYANTATTRTNSTGRTYTLTSIKDSGGTSGGGVDTTTVSIASTVTIVNPPTVASPTSASLAATTATLGGDVTSAGGGTVTARGVVVSLTSANASPQISGTGVTNITGTGTTGVFTVSATGLTASSAYSYAAYATNAAGTSYSSVGTFTTTAASPGTLEILSKKDPAEANFATSHTGDVAASANPAISTDGRYVAFRSSATNLVANQSATGGSSTNNIYLRDRTSNTTKLVSGVNGSATVTAGLSTAGTAISISADGRYVAFLSTATNLISGLTDTNAAADVFLYDRDGNSGAGSLTLVSHTASLTTTTGAGASSTPLISRDGSAIVFASAATDHVSPFTAGTGNALYRYERSTGAITLASPKNGATTSATGLAAAATLNAISDDGRWIAFNTAATDAVASQVAGAATNTFLFDAQAGTTRLLNRAFGTTASAANGITSGTIGLGSDGRYVTFLSAGTNLVSGQTGTGAQVYLYNRVADTITLVSRSTSGATVGGNAAASFPTSTLGLPVMSGDGRFIAFASAATDLVASYTGTGTQYYLYDRLGNSGAGTLTLITHTTASATAGTAGSLVAGVLSPNGSRFVFASNTTDLMTGITYASTNTIHAYNTLTGAFTFVSGTAANGAAANTVASSLNPVISPDGTLIGFSSGATDFAANDNNALTDIFGSVQSLVTVAPEIYGSATASGTYGTAFSYTITAANTPTSYALATGTLPTGVTLNTTTGVISGTPTQFGSFNVTLTATNAGGTSGSFALAITLAKASITIAGVTASNKTYDGNATATLSATSATLTGVVSGDTVTVDLAGATGTFSDKTVANGKTVTIAGVALGGSSAGNYTLSAQPSAATANIAAAALTVTGVTASNKTYDATLTATLTGTAALSGVVSGDTVALAGTAAGAFATKTVATGKTVTVSGLTISGTDSGNYTLTQPTTTASITAAALTVTGVTASNKTYDATLTATLTGTAALSGVVSGDTVTLGGTAAGAFATKTVATGKTVTVSGLTISGTDSGNYTLTQPTTTANITAAALTITGVTASNKAYDATLTATLVTGTAALSGVVSGDTVTLGSGSATGAFPAKTIGTGLTVTTAGFAISGADSGNYTLTQPATTANITAAALTVTGLSASNKTYDATLTATLTGTAALSGVVSGDTVTLAGTAAGAFATKTVATGKTVSVSGLTISGTDSGNYTLTQPTTTADITAATLTVTGVTASNKTYDATLTATLTGTAALSGVVSGDTVTLGGTAAGAFATKVIGTGKTVTVSGLTISGTDSGNYTLTQPTTTANITAAALTITGVTASNKTYDATLTATLVTGTAALSGVVSGDTVTLGSGSATGAFPAKTIGTGLTVTTAGFAISGADSGNYTLTQPTTTANITAAPLTVTGLTASNKTYNATLVATLTGSAALSGVVSGDTVTLGGTAAGAFATKVIGTGKTVTVSGLAISGTDSGNYTLTQPTTTADITAAALTVTGVTASNKTYDATLTATLVTTSAALSGVISGDTVALGTGSAAGAFATKVIGTGKTVTVSGLAISGADSGNYTLTQPTTTANITAAPLTITGVTASNKTYDATLTATLVTGSAALSGVVSGDTVTLGSGSATGAFPAKTIGTGLTVTTAGFAISGADSGNYTLTQPTTTANITAAPLTVTGITASNKTYNATLVATLATGSAALSGVVSGDTVTLGGTAAGAFATKVIGTGKTVTVSGLTISGADSGNYTLTQPTTTANITAAALTVTGVTASNKIYDATNTATLVTTSAALSGVVSGDTVSVATLTAAGTFPAKTIGTGLTVTTTGFTLAGADSGNYTLSQPTTTADITAKNLTVTGVTASNKTYDKTLTAAFVTTSAALNGVVSGDTVTIDTAAIAGTFANKNIGTAKAVTVTGVTIAGADSGNYTLTQPALTADIAAVALTVTGITASNKTYDALLAATINSTAATLNGVLSAETVTLSTATAVGTFATKVIGTAKTVTTTGLTLGGADAGNYVITNPTTTADITAAALTIAGVTANDRTYDATLVAALNTGTAALVGLAGADTVTLSVAGATGAFATKTIGTGKTVTTSGFATGGADAGNYTLTQPATTASIAAKNLTVTGITASNKTYDAGLVATLATGTSALVGVVSGDTVTLATGSATGAFASKTIGTGKTVQVSGLTLTGTDAGNYTVTQPATTADITAKNLTVAGTTASDKIYDATVTATPVFTASSLVGVVSGDTVSLVTGTAVATFADKLVATGKTVTLTGLTLGGADSGNYTLTQPTTTATITAKELTVSGITATSRVYDATTVAALNTGTAALVGIAGADTVTLSTTAAAGAFATKAIGTAKPVTISGLTISGTDSANYTLTQPGTTADVTAKNLTITGTTAANKVYDRLLTAAPDFTASALVGIVAGDTVTLVTGAATASFADKLVATGKTVQLAGLTLAGADAGNYTVTQPATTADITTKGLTVSGITAATRIYDATTVAALSTGSAALVGIVVGDTVTLSTTAAAGAFATKVIATAKTVQVSGLTISGADSANYALTQPTTTADITAKNLTVTGITAASKVYDGNTVAALTTTGAALVGIAGADTVTLVTGAATGAFANANAGLGKTVQVSGLTLAGADAGNYTVTQPTATATITPANVTIAFASLSHTYDGTPKSATITATPSSSLSIVYSNAGGVAPTNAGSYLVTANVSDTNYSGSGSATLVIAKAAQTVSFSITGTNFNVGSTLGLVASASSGLPVTFSVVSGAASLSGASATVTTAGATTLRATQAGNDNYLSASADAGFTGVSAAKTAQTITFPAIANRITTDTAIVLTATASSGLPVTYTLQSGSPAFLSGGNTVVLTGSPGTVVIVASQAGDATFAAAPDVTRTFGVNDEGSDTFFGDLVEDPGLFGGEPGRGELLSAPGYRAEATKSGDIAAVLFPGTRRGSLIIVSAALGLNVSLDFVLNPDGTYTVPFTSAGRTLSLTGSLTGTTLVGRLPALRVSFSTQVQARTGLTAGLAGYYESDSLNTATGGTASIVGPNGQLLIVATTSTVSTGALGTVSADGKFTVAAPGATISGAVDAPTTTVSGTIVVPGQPTVNFSGLAATTARTDRLINLSSRVRVGPSPGRTLITGFVIGGTETKRVLLRAVGPALTGFGVQGALSNPRIMLFDGTGKLLLENDDWTGADTAASTTRVGAFALAANSKDAALFTTLAPGAYTMHIVDGGETGVALAEIYDASVNPNSEYQRLVNISTRGEAGTGENVLIGGFIITGNAPKKVLIRGIGPSLGAFGVPGTLDDPRLRVFRNGELIGENDNWSTVAVDAAATAQAARDTGAFTLAANSKDAALILTLAPGAYTAQVGATDGTSTGVALVEIYEIP